MIARLVTLLPEPDSPTMPSVLPRSSVNDSPSTDLTRPSSVGKWIRRSVARRLPTRPGVVRRWQSRLHPRVDDGVQEVDDQVRQDDEEAAEQVTPEDLGRSWLLMASTRELADAVEREGRLGEHRAAEQQAEVEAEDGQDRGERRAQAVLDDDLRSVRPLARAVRM